ncbi:MAG: ABC transporter ATP-binding protein [Ignavibacteria bacterium]|nr:ABC transporter ATP-binding protein [Ignavibacteria bacterium]
MIRVEKLTKKFGKVNAVAGVTFSVKEGEAFAFLGPNGSGKTTTMKTIVGLNVPSDGSVMVGGLDVRRFPRETRRLISYLPQRVIFPERQTAREVLHFYAGIRKAPRQRADEVMEEFRFSQIAERPVGEFSGGMIQRLGLAVASLADAPVLLLDEPTANLDPHGVKRFREFVLRQKERGKTILFSTHLLPEAEQLADRVGIFVGGELVSEESVDHLRLAFQASRTIEDMYLRYVGSGENE